MLNNRYYLNSTEYKKNFMTQSPDSGALFSTDERFRYLLWRVWNAELPVINFCMLNPSTADESKNDPTVERCQRRAVAAGYGALIVTNLFALRSTDPAALYRADEPVGAYNDYAIIEASNVSQTVVCAWGNHGGYRDRSAFVLRSLQASRVALPMHLGLNAGGQPKHPLYVGYGVSLSNDWGSHVCS